MFVLSRKEWQMSTVDALKILASVNKWAVNDRALKNLNGLNLWISPKFPHFSTTGCKQTRGASGHLGLVMAKLAEINFNLERAIECTWPRTLRDGRRVLLWPLLPQIGPTGWLVCATFMSPLEWYIVPALSQRRDQYFGSLTHLNFYTEHNLDLFDVCKKGR